MAPTRLNLSALLESLKEKDSLTGLTHPFLRSSSLLTEQPVSRRTAVKVTGSAVAAFFPVVHRLHGLLGGLDLVGDHRRLAFVLGGRERWVIDVNRFSGSPVLRRSQDGDGVRIELRNARFPGTRLPADFVCEVTPGLLGSRLRLKLAFGGYDCVAPFEDWLLGRAAAGSRVRLSQQACRLGNGMSLALAGRGEAELSPDWTLTLRGDGLAALKGRDVLAQADGLTLALSGPDDQSLIEDAPSRRTLITLERGGRTWRLNPSLGLEGPGALRFEDQPFDFITIETAQDGRKLKRALVASAAAGRACVFFVPGGDLQDGAGMKAQLPLVDAHYAVAFDRSAEGRALLARYAEPAWLHGDGFSIEVGDGEGAVPFEVVADGDGPQRVRCEPALTRLVAPIPGAIVEPAELPSGARIALARPLNGDAADAVRANGASAPAARLVFPERGAVGLAVDAVPPLPILRPEDMLVVTFQFLNMSLQIEGAGEAKLVPEAGQHEAPGSFVIVHFQQQNIAEEAFWERAKDQSGANVNLAQQDSEGDPLSEGDPGYEENPSDDEDPRIGDIPVAARIAGRSRLVFGVPDETESIAYTLDALFDWSALEPSLVASALPPPPPPPQAFIRPLQLAPQAGTRIPKPQLTATARRLTATVEVDARTQESVAAELAANMERGARVPPQRLEAIAATLTQTRPGYRAVPGPVLAKIVAQLLRRPYQPNLHETALETPWRLILSPNRFSAWAHSVRSVADEETGITELWHTRLGVLRAGELEPGVSPVDEDEDYYRTLRAVWSPDYDRDASQDDPPHYPESDVGNPFRMSLDARDRHELVTLTSDFLLPDAEDRFVRADRFMLSSLGAWMNTRAAWELRTLPPDAQDVLSVEEWRHRATMGRDHYVKVVYRGFLFPFGHRASLIKVTERKFKWTRQHNTAFLRQRMYVVVRQPVKNFPAPYQPNDGRKFPFRRVRLATLATPSLDRPEDSDLLDKGQGAFWMKVGGSDFLFRAVAEDLEGRDVEFSVPLAFIDGKFAVDAEVANAAATSLADSAQLNTRAVDGQKVAYAKSEKAGDTTFETESLTLGAEVLESPSAAALRALDQPRFWPGLDGAAVELPAIKHIVGASGAVPIRYPQRYLEKGFGGDANDASGNAGEIFAELTEAVDLVFGGGSAGTDKVGGLTNPDFNITGLSRLSGPISGDLEEMMKGSFDPSKFFAGLDAKILGGITLLDIVEALVGFAGQLTGLKTDMDSLLGDLAEQLTAEMLESLPKCKVPALFTQIIHDAAEAVEDLDNAAKLPKQVQLTFKWDPQVKTMGPFIVNGDPEDTLSLTSVALIPINLGGEPKEPSYTVTAKLQDFTLNLFNVIAINVNDVRFKKQRGEKTDVKADVQDVEFQGPLAFVENLQNVIPSNGFVDADIDLSPTGISAGFSIALPTIGVGVLTIDNMSLGGGLTVPFTGDPLRFRFNFCTREQPFSLTVYALGGGGFFGIELGLDGVELMEAALEFGASIAVDFGVASGGVSVKAGIYFAMEGDAATLTGYFRLNGHVDVLGLITASILFYLALTYQSSPKMVWGEATLTIEVEVLFFSASVSITARKEFATPEAPKFAELMTEDEWVQYRLAYAE